MEGNAGDSGRHAQVAPRTYGHAHLHLMHQVHSEHLGKLNDDSCMLLQLVNGGGQSTRSGAAWGLWQGGVDKAS